MSLLGDRLRGHARDHGDAHAVHARGQWWTYRDLVTRADQLAASLGIASGDAVVVAIYSGIEAVVAICAAALVDAIPVLVDPRDREQAERTIADSRPACVVTSSDVVFGGRTIEVDRDRAPRVGDVAALAWTATPRPPTISHVLFTSGSTARAKGIVWSQLRAGYDWRMTQQLPEPPRPGGIIAPLCTGLGLHDLLRSLYQRRDVAILDMPFLAAIAEIDALGIDRLKLTPTHVEILLATAAEIASVRRISITSASIKPARVRALAERVPNAKIARTYGLNECGVATMVWLHANPGKLATVGRANSDRRVTVRDAAGRVLAPGEVGEVVVEVPAWDAVDGYLDPTPELQRRFENGVLWTGDRGTLDERGFLTLGGRLSEILKVGGRSVSAPRIEQSLTEIAGIAEVVVVGVPDRFLGEVPCAVFVPTPSCDPSSLVGGAPLGATTPADDAPRWYLPRRSLPRGASGKLRRGLLAHEAARWTRTFVGTIVAGDRSYPAFDLDNGVAVVDGIPHEWRRSDSVIDPYTRVIALVARRPTRPLAFGAIRSGADALVVLGPIAVALETAEVTRELLDMFAGELARLARLLPGEPAEVRIDAAHETLRAWAGHRPSATSER